MKRLKLQLEKIISNYFNEKAIYGLDEDLSDSKKLSNVREVHNIGDEEIFFIYDDTLFGSAKDGMVFSEDAIYWREKFSNPEKLTYAEIAESTANINIMTNEIRIFDKERAQEKDKLIKVKDLYYEFISELREELIDSIPRYEGYYENAINSMEIFFIELELTKQYRQIINMISLYEGLFLREEDKSNKIRSILFKAYLSQRIFEKAKKELDYMEKENLEFYHEAKKMYELELKENEYDFLEEKRKIALAREDYEEAYFVFNQQKEINIRDEDYLLKIEDEIKEAEYKTLDIERLSALDDYDYEKAYSILNRQKEIKIKDLDEMQEVVNSMKLHEFNSLEEERLMALEKEEFNIAYLIFKKQKQLNIKEEDEIKEIKKSIEEEKSKVLKKYHEELKSLVDEKLFIESKKVIDRIYEINPDYSLDKEEILLMIYQYRLDEAKESIAKLENMSLKSELEKVFNNNSEKIYAEMRNAARIKDYSYFEFFPHLWNYKDEYSMSPIHYFALEGDSEGLLRALDGTNHKIMHSNIFGHDFLDLLGLACDPRFGNTKESLLEILKRIEYFVENDQINKRIKYIERGICEEFYSYNISEDLLDELKEKEILRIQEIRLRELNNKIMSSLYFKNVEKLIENRSKKANIDEELDRIIKILYIEEVKRKNEYPIKDEFETREKYKRSCDDYIEESLKDPDYIEEYKKQNPETIEEIRKSIKYPERYFIAELLSFVDYKEKTFKQIKTLDTNEGFLELLSLYFPIKYAFIEIGNYNIEKEEFYILVNEKIQTLSVPKSLAKEFKESFFELDYTSHRILEDNEIKDIYIYKIQEKEISLVFKTRKNILNL